MVRCRAILYTFLPNCIHTDQGFHFGETFYSSTPHCIRRTIQAIIVDLFWLLAPSQVEFQAKLTQHRCKLPEVSQMDRYCLLIGQRGRGKKDGRRLVVVDGKGIWYRFTLGRQLSALLILFELQYCHYGWSSCTILPRVTNHYYK